MVSLSDLCEGRLYLYEYNGTIAIGEYVVEYVEDHEHTEHGFEDKYFADIWSEDNSTSITLDIDHDTTDVTILKEVGNAYLDYNLNVILSELKEEFPEYFI